MAAAIAGRHEDMGVSPVRRDSPAARFLNALRGLVSLLEKRGEYTYETIDVKRWIAEADACEICEENADRGWIPDDDVFESEQFGDIDEPPAHTHCQCSIEYGEKRKRVYD